MAKSLKKVLLLYSQGEYIVKLTLMDKDFDAVKEHLMSLEINKTASREHLEEIERDMLQVKECVRCMSSEFQFQFIQTMLLIYTVYIVCLWLNTFPLRSGIT